MRRFNPALVERVPAQATLYLPSYVSEFGPDVAFWRRPPGPSYAAALDDFLRLDAGPEQWDDPAFAPILANFKRRFRETNTEEGAVMETVLAYAMDQAYTSPRRALLTEFRHDEQVWRLIERGVGSSTPRATRRSSAPAPRSDPPSPASNFLNSIARNRVRLPSR